MKNKPSFILTVSCPGRSGIVAAIGNFLADRACFIKELHQYDDLDFGRFFCTIEFFFEGDQKPRVEQMVERVSHSHDSEHLTLVGRDTEAQTLARAVKNHVRHRVFLNGLRTVVF